MTAQKTTVKEYIEWTNLRWNNAPDTTLPRILLVGDSIVAGHGDLLFDIIKEKISVDYLATAKCVSDINYMTELNYMLSLNHYTIIIFNNGLHGWDIDDSVYTANLREVLTALKASTRMLLWRNSTPIRTVGDLSSFDAQRNPRVIKRNAAAAEIANELELPVIDLYTPMAVNPDLFSSDAIHYTPEGRTVQAEIIAAGIKKLAHNLFS
jgi:lysophospholipase L1-like esterase